MTEGTRYEAIARDERELERQLIKEMRTSPDPMTREIGAGLADGSMTWRTVATSAPRADDEPYSGNVLKRRK